MAFKSRMVALAAIGLLMVGGAPAVAQDGGADPELNDNDPIEGVNRVIFEVNDVLDRFILRPIAIVYRNVVPDFAQDRIRNTLNNLDSPVIFANDLMQGEFDRAGATMSRFMINSTVGVAGLFDVADELGVPRHTEDFGQTLAVWGLGEGPYLYLPLLGPSNPRDLVGRIVDMGLDPLSYVDWEDEDLEWVPYTRYGLDVVDLRARNIEVLDNLRETSVDYYAAIRSSYRQLRNDAIRNGEVDIEDLPAIE